MLKTDVNKWNQWQQKHPDTAIDLSKAKLRNSDLSNADLSGSQFLGANLHRANLSNTDLDEGHFGSIVIQPV